VFEQTYFSPIWPQLPIRWSVFGVLSCYGRQEAEIVNDDLPLWCGDANVLNISIWPQVGAPNAVNDLGLYLLWLVSSLTQDICFLRLWGTDTDLTKAREVAVGCAYGACPHMTPDLASSFFRGKTLNQKQRTVGLRLFVEEVIRRSHVYRTAELESEGGGAIAARERDDKPLCQMPAAAAPAPESALASASGGSASSSLPVLLVGVASALRYTFAGRHTFVGSYTFMHRLLMCIDCRVDYRLSDRLSDRLSTAGSIIDCRIGYRLSDRLSTVGSVIDCRIGYRLPDRLSTVPDRLSTAGSIIDCRIGYRLPDRLSTVGSAIDFFSPNIGFI
jgi:hypothetical protein